MDAVKRDPYDRQYNPHSTEYVANLISKIDDNPELCKEYSYTTGEDEFKAVVDVDNGVETPRVSRARCHISRRYGKPLWDGF
jgi:hypothetical protein